MRSRPRYRFRPGNYAQWLDHNRARSATTAQQQTAVAPNVSEPTPQENGATHDPQDRRQRNPGRLCRSLIEGTRPKQGRNDRYESSAFYLRLRKTVVGVGRIYPGHPPVISSAAAPLEGS